MLRWLPTPITSARFPSSSPKKHLHRLAALAHDGGMRLHVHEFGPGAGRTVVALHGGTGQPQVFRRLADRLPEVRFVAPAFGGHSEWGKEPPWDLWMHLRDVRETLDSLGISRAPFIGYSFGGRV